MLEAADNEFSQVKIELDNLRESYAKSFASGHLDIAINSESIFTYLKNSETVSSIISEAIKAGLKVGTADETEAAKRLASSSEMLGYKSIADIDQYLRSLLPETQDYFRFMSEKLQESQINRKMILLLPAAVRYLMLGFAPSGKRQLINKKYAPVPGYADAMVAFAKQRKIDP